MSATRTGGEATGYRGSGYEESHGEGWVMFAGIMIMIAGTLNFIYGIAAISNSHFYVANTHYVISDLKTWGWVTLIWGIVLALSGLALLGGAGWARWFAIVVGCLNFIVQLGFVGSAQYPLWTLTALALTAIVLYALIVRWEDRETA